MSCLGENVVSKNFKKKITPSHLSLAVLERGLGRGLKVQLVDLVRLVVVPFFRNKNSFVIILNITVKPNEALTSLRPTAPGTPSRPGS